jgi:hypothetical protein
VMASSRRTRTALLACLLSVGSVRSPAQEPAPEPKGPAGAFEGDSARDNDLPGLPDWLEPPAETPIADSIEPAVERFIRENLASCELAGEGVPCFPVSIQVKGRMYSVRESLENLQLGDRRVPGSVPSAADMIQYGANPHPASAGVGVGAQAIACKTKQLLKKIQGRSQKYYLYRVWDETGERAVLRDRPFDADELAGSPEFHYVSLGEFSDECEAIQAYRKSTHEVRMRRQGEAESGRGPSLKVRPGSEPD